MKDPYRTLNVARTADQGAIKAAYRKLAKTLHPDRNPGNHRAEQRFKDVSQAYDLLSDADKRARFDRGEIDADGNPRRTFNFNENPFGGAGAGDGPFRSNAEAIFERMFGAGFGGGRAGFSGGFGRGGATGAGFGRTGNAGNGTATGDRPRRGSERTYRIEVDFLTAARGGKARLELADGRSIDVDVPVGTDDGQRLRLKNQGDPGAPGGPRSDALVQIAVKPHPRFTRSAQVVHIELPISVPEAIAGAKVTVPTIDGPVRITIPAGSNSGRLLRLKGRGIAAGDGTRGDQHVKLMVTLPEPPDPELRRWAETNWYDARANRDDP